MMERVPQQVLRRKKVQLVSDLLAKVPGNEVVPFRMSKRIRRMMRSHLMMRKKMLMMLRRMSTWPSLSISQDL